MLDRIWTSPRRGAAVTIGLAAAAGVAWAVLMPRGPVTTPHALASLVGATALGIAVGFVTGRRWSSWLAIVAVMSAFEAVRLLVLRVGGPTIETIQLGSTYGLIAFILGRGVAAVLMLLPVLVGGPWGVELAARAGHPRAVRLGIAGWLAVAAGTIALAGLVLQFAGGASTPPVLTPDDVASDRSIAELSRVNLGGHDQAVMIRGRNVDNPLLLYLAGGPGGTDIGAMRADVGLEQDFVVVTWEQRGAGKSYASLDPVETLTVDSMVADTIELADVLRERFDEDRIYLAGNSWGSILGVLAVQRQPDRFHAFVGTGQMVSPSATDRMFWDDSDREMPAILFVPENDTMDRINGLRAFFDTFAVLYQQFQGLDLRENATRLEVPVYLVIGAQEARGRAALADEWFALLDAPAKERVVFDDSGHRPHFDQPAEFAALMRRVVAETQVLSEVRSTQR
jgi:pimeloyl-ACP methyl ester carboxylesterase